jgi:hypothetical protein
LQERQQHLAHWVPAQADILVKTRVINGKKAYYVVPGRPFTGRLYKLDVMFPKNKLRVPAQLASTSTEHDVALLKIHMPNAVPKVTMHDSYQDMLSGTPVTILGYPHGLPHVDTVRTSTAPFSGPETAMGVPGLMATPGFIGQLIREDAFIAGIGGDRMDAHGDGFQLSVRTIDRGNRGGPVFDQRGRVIGIFNYDVEDRIQTSTVVPIRFGMEIMGVTPGLD